jgi:hypothetical protein
MARTATTPVITALQNSARIGSMGEKLMSTPIVAARAAINIKYFM